MQKPEFYLTLNKVSNQVSNIDVRVPLSYPLGDNKTGELNRCCLKGCFGSIIPANIGSPCVIQMGGTGETGR